MVRRRRRRIAEQRTSYLTGPNPSLPPYASTPDEIQRAVERNSIKRGVFIIKNLMALNLDGLLRKIEQIAAEYDMGLNTTSYEAGLAPSSDIAQDLAHHFNQIISALVKVGQVTPQRHLEMAYANLGDSLGGAWRNEVGRLAYVEVITPLALHLHHQGYLASIVYKLKGRVVRDANDEEVNSRQIHELVITESLDLEAELVDLEEQRIVYRELRLRNGNRLLLNRQITWRDDEGQSYRIGPDLFSANDEDDMLWGGELKGGADPAGSDEHWKTATRAFDRILLACERTHRPKPPLSFIATILVERVAREAADWIEQGKLKSVYNLTQIADDPKKQRQFLDDLTTFLGCS